MVPIIALIAKKRAGKDTVCALLKNLSPVPVHRVAFADPLKEEVCRALNVDLPFVEEHKLRLRPLLQWWGTEWRREMFGQNYWVEQTAAKVDSIKDGIIVATDCRFPNEIDMLVKRGALTVRIDRDVPSEGHESHVSESYIDSFHTSFRINNNGTLDDLRAQCALLLRHISDARPS